MFPNTQISPTLEQLINVQYEFLELLWRLNEQNNEFSVNAFNISRGNSRLLANINVNDLKVLRKIGNPILQVRDVKKVNGLAVLIEAIISSDLTKVACIGPELPPSNLNDIQFEYFSLLWSLCNKNISFVVAAFKLKREVVERFAQLSISQLFVIKEIKYPLLHPRIFKHNDPLKLLLEAVVSKNESKLTFASAAFAL